MSGGLTITGLALRNLARRPARTGLTIVGVAVAIGALIALLALARGLETALRSSLSTRGTDIVVSEDGAIDLVSSIVPENLANTLAALPQVESASPELIRMTVLADGASIPVVAWPAGSYLWQALTVEAGRLPAPDRTLEVMLGRRLAEHLGLTPGDRVDLFHESFTVVGLIESDSMLNRNLAFAVLGDVQRLTYRDGQATTIHVALAPMDDAGERDAALALIRERLDGYAVDAAEAFSKANIGARIADALSWSISVVAIVMAAMNDINTLGRAVNERRQEIAIMRAVGWPARRIMTCVMIEGFALCLSGGLIGAVAGYLGAWAIAEAPAIRGFFQPSMSVELMAYAVAATVLLGTVGSLVPALRATSIGPAEILRGR